MIEYISNIDHYNKVLARVASVKRSLWIGTADIKDLHVKVGETTKPFLAVIALLIRSGVEVRLIHAKEPGPNFREDFDRYPVLYDRLERVLCPRVHFKMLIFDCQEVYIGSANLTGAGIGMKTADKRNFEAGILTDDPAIVEQAMNQFDELWIGRHCKTASAKTSVLTQSFSCQLSLICHLTCILSTFCDINFYLCPLNKGVATGDELVRCVTPLVPLSPLAIARSNNGTRGYSEVSLRLFR